MTRVDDYRKNAAETMQLARRATTTEDKSRLMKLAEAWLDLADRTLEVARRAPDTQRLHPLVREKFEQQPDDP